MRRPRPVVEAFDAPPDLLEELPHRAVHHPDSVPHQSIVRGMMNVGLHHSGVVPKLLAIFQTQFNGGLHDHLVDGLDRLRRQSIEGLVKGV
jgi:hypothetical protein